MTGPSGRPSNYDSIPNEGKGFLFCRPVLVPTLPLICWIQTTLPPGLKLPGHEAHYPPLSHARVLGSMLL
jgi:hypothetical protein